MAARKGLVLSLGFDARGAFDEMVTSFGQKIKEMQNEAGKAKIGDQLANQFEELWEKLKETQQRTDEMYEKLQNGETVDTKGFEAFSQKVTSQFQDIQKQIDDLKTAMSALSGGQMAQGLVESFNNAKKEIQQIRVEVESINSTFDKLFTLSGKYGQNINNIADSTSQSLKQIRKNLKQTQKDMAKSNYAHNKYGRYLKEGEQGVLTFGDDEEGDRRADRFKEDYEKHVKDLTGLIPQIQSIAKEMNKLKSDGLENTDEWYVALSKRAQVSKKIIDLYTELQGLEEINYNIFEGAEDTSAPMNWLNDSKNKSGQKVIDVIKAQMQSYKNELNSYLQSFDPQTISASFFEFKDGAIKIPVDLDLVHGTRTLTNKIQEQVKEMQSIVDSNPLQVPIALKGVAIRGQGQTKALLKKWGYDFDEAKGAIDQNAKNINQAMGDAIADEGIETPSIDLGDQYAKAYLDSFHFAAEALKLEIAKMKEQFLENGKPIKIPIDFDYEDAVQSIRSTLSSIGKDQEGNVVPIFENLSVPEEMQSKLSEAGQTAASSWQSAMLSSITSVATAFQSAMGKGLQLDSTMLQGSISAIKNQLSMALGKLPTDANSQASIASSVNSSFIKAYARVQKEASEGKLYDDKLGVMDTQLRSRTGFIHYFEQTFQYLQKLKQMGGDVSTVLSDLGKLGGVPQEDLITIGNLFTAFEAENPVPENISNSIKSIIINLNLLQETLTGLSETVAGIESTLPADGAFGIQPGALDSVIGKVQEMIDLFKQVHNIATSQEIELQWKNVQKAYKEVDPMGAIKAYRGNELSGVFKEQFDEFYKEYQKYINMGGKKQVADLESDERFKYITDSLDQYVNKVRESEKEIGEPFKEGMGNAGIDAANDWKNAMISAIEEVKTALQGMFKFQSDNKIYDFLKGWTDADRIMREHRKGKIYDNLEYVDRETGQVNNFTHSTNPGSGELERAAFYNSKTGEISNTYTVDQKGSTGMQNALESALEKFGISVDKFDTALHSHPIDQGEDYGLKSIGHNLSFSDADIYSYLGKEIGSYDGTPIRSAGWIHSGIKKLAVQSNGMINQLDLSSLSDDIKYRISQLYTNWINSKEWSEAWNSALDYSKGVLDYDKRDAVTHEKMRGFIRQAIIEDAQKNGQEIPEQIDTSKYYRQFSIEEFNKPISQDGAIYIQKLAQSIHNISTAIGDLNAKGGFDFKIDTSSLSNLDTHLQSIVSTLQSLKQSYDLTFGNFSGGGAAKFFPQRDIVQEEFNNLSKKLKEGYDGDYLEELPMHFKNTFSRLQKYEALTNPRKSQMKDIFQGIDEITNGRIGTYHFEDAYKRYKKQNPIPQNMPQTLQEVISQINQISSQATGKDGSLFGISSDQINEVITKLQELAEVLRQFSSSDFGGFSGSIDKVVEAIGKLSGEELAIKPQAFSQINSQLENMLHLLEQAYGIFSDQSIEAQWGIISDKFTQLTEAAPHLDLRTQKKDIADLAAEYQKYLNMGGTKSYTELTDDKTAIGKLSKFMPTAAQEANKSIPETRVSITSNVEEIDNQLDTLVQKLQELSGKEYPIKLTIPTVGELTGNIETLLSSVSDDSKVRVLKETLDELANTLGRINNYKNTGSIFKGLKLSDANLEVLDKIPGKIVAIRDSLKNFPTNSSEFFSGITKILENAKALQNLVTALKAKKSDLDAASNVINGRSTGQKAKTSSQIGGEYYTAITNRYTDILKKTKSIKRGTPDSEVKEIEKAIQADYDVIKDFQQKIDSDRTLFNAGKDDKIKILQQQIELEKQLQTIRRAAAEQAQDNRETESLERQLEVVQALMQDSLGWENAIKALKKAGVYDSMGDIAKIDRRIRRDEKTDEYYVSYRATDTRGNNTTVGMNGDLLIDNEVAANPQEMYKGITKHLQNILKLRTQLAGLDKNAQPRAYQNTLTLIAQEEKAISDIKEQALDLRELIPGIMDNIQKLETEFGQKTSESIRMSLDSVKDSVGKQFKDLEQQYGEILNNSPDLKNQLQNLRLRTNGATDITQLNDINDQIASLKGNLSELSAIDTRHAGWMTMIDSFGDLSGVQEWANALDRILDKIAEYETLTAKLRKGEKLTTDQTAVQKQRESEITSDLDRLKRSTAPEQMANLDQRKDLIRRANEIMKEMSSLNVQNAIAGYDENRTPEIIARLEVLDQKLQQIKQDAANLEATIPGIENQISQMQARYSESTQKGITDSVNAMQSKLTNDLNKIKTAYGELAESPELKSRFDVIKDSVSSISSKNDIPDIIQQIKQLGQALKELDKSNVKVAGWTDSLEGLDKTGKIQKFKDEIADISTKIEEYRDLMNKKASGQVLTDLERSNLNNAEKQINRRIADLQRNTGGKYNISNKYGTVQTWENMDDVQNYYRTLSDVDASSVKITTSNDKVSASFRKLNGEIVNSTTAFDAEMGVWREMSSTTVQTANIFDRIGNSIKKSASYFKSYFSGYMVAQKIVSSVRNAISTIQDLDSQFAEMQKVSQDSYSSLREYADGAYESAQRLGATTSDILNSTADFLRIGQDIDKAGKSAETAAILKNVSQYENISDATDSLIAMEQAYQDVDPMSIVDKLNLVGDRFAISTDELADGMKNAGSTLSLLGNSIDDTAALLTSANTVIQDISKVSSGMRTIALRVVGTEEGKAKLEEDGEDTGDYVIETKAKKRAKIKKYTATASNKQGVDILDENGNYKTTYEYMRQISKVYKEIQEQDKKFGTNRAVALIEELAGKNRSNIASAILSNPELLEQVKNTSQNSAGSALREQEIQLESIQGRLATFSAHAEEFWTSFIDTDVVKGVISFGSDVLGLITKITKAVPSLTTAFSGLIALFATKGNFGIFGYDRHGGENKKGAFSLPFFSMFQKYKASEGTQAALSNLRGMSQQNFDIIKANQNNNIKEYLSSFDGADQRIGGFIAACNNGQEAVSQFNAQIGNTTPIKTFVSNLGSGIKTLAGNFLSFAGNMAVAWAASMAIKGVITLIDSLVVSTEEMIEAGEKARDTIGEIRDDIKSESDVIKEAEEVDFDKLMGGVDKKTNDNISLTDEQYQQYLSTCNEIAEVFPQVVASYDAQGNAILNLGTNAQTATEQLQGLLDADKEIAGIKIAENLQDAYMGIKAEAEGADGFGGIAKQIQDEEDKIKKAENIISHATGATKGYSSDNPNLVDDVIAQLKSNAGELDLTNYSDEIYAVILETLRNQGAVTESSEWGKLKFDPSKINNTLLSKINDALTTATGEEVVATAEELQEAYAAQAEGSQKKAVLEKELAATYAKLIPDIQSAVENNPNFAVLDETIQSKLLDSLSNIDLQKLPEDVKTGQTELIDYLKDRYLYPISMAFTELSSDTEEIRQAKEAARTAFNNIFSETAGKMTGSEYIGYVRENKKIIEDYFKQVYGDTAQAAQKAGEFFETYGLEDVNYIKQIENALGLDTSGRRAAYKELKDLTVDQQRQILDIIEDPKFGGTLKDAIKSVTEDLDSGESVKLSDIIGSTDDDASIASLAATLREAASAIDTYRESINNGEFQRSSFSELLEKYPELQKNAELVNDVWNSFDASGFLTETDAINEALDNIQLNKLQDFRKKFAEEYSLIQDETEKQAARDYYQSVVSGLIPKNATNTSTAEYLAEVASNIGLASFGATDYLSEQYQLLRNTVGTEYGNEAVLRILADPSLAEMSVDELKQYIENTKAEIQIEVNQEGIKNAISEIQSLGTKNNSLKEFETNLVGGKATTEDLLSILNEYPQVVNKAGDSLDKLFKSGDFQGQLDNLSGMNDLLGELRYENLQDSINKINSNGRLKQDQKALLRRTAFANTDLSGISAQNASKIVSTYANGNKELEEMAESTNALEREAAAASAGLGISFEQAFDRAKAKADQLNISAVQSFQSMADEVSSFGEKVASGEATSGDILGLVETFPDLLKETDVLGDAFSQLSLTGAVTDASTLQALLQQIAQTNLKNVLSQMGSAPQEVVQGLANSLDFSNTSRQLAGSWKQQMEESGYDLSNINLDTAEGLDIMGRIHFVYVNSDQAGREIQKIIDDSSAQGVRNGVEKGLAQVKNLSDSMSSLSSASQSIMAGEFGIDDIASLEEQFGDLNISGEQLSAIYSSLNMEGFVQDAEAANALINELKLNKLSQFFSKNESLSGSAQQAILNSTRLTGIGEAEGRAAFEALNKRAENGEAIDLKGIQRLLDAGEYDALVRLNLITTYDGYEDFGTATQAAIEAAGKDTNLEFQTNLEVLTNLSSKNNQISDFADQVATGEATVDGLLSLLQETPELALNSGDALAQMIESANFDGTITSIDGLQAAANSFTLENLEKQFKQIESVTDNTALQDALKSYMTGLADLSGTTTAQASSAIQRIDDAGLRKQVNERFRKGEFSAEAIYKVFLKGQIDDSDVIEKIEAEQGKIERSDLQATVNAQINLNSNLSSLNGLNESIISGEATTDDVLNLMNSMPDFLEQMQELGFVISDFDMDGMADNVDMIQTAIGKTKYKELTKFLDQNKNASQAQKMWNIMNTGLKGITAADHDLKNSALYDLVKGGGYSDEAVIKTDMMLDNGLISDNASSIQAMLNSLDTDVKIKTKLEDFQQTMTGLDSVTTAISEMNDTGNISAETIQAMKQAGIEYNDLLFETESGIKINTSAAEELTDSLANAGIAMADVTKNEYATQIRKNTSEMQKMVDEYNEAHGTAHTLAGVLMDVGKYGSEFADVFALDSVNQGLHSTIDTLSSLQGELRNSIDLFSKLQAAQSSANPSDNYNTITSAGETAKELWDQGWTGKDDFTSFAELIAPNWDQENETFDEWAENAVVNFEQNYEKVKKYLTEDASGLYTFLDDAEAQGFYKETGNGMELIVDDLDAFADSMGISTSLAEQFMFALSDIGMNVEFDSITDKFRQSVEGLNESLDNGEVIGNAGRQIQNAVDEFGYLSESGADARTALEPLIASMNKFHQMNPDQDIQPWIDQLNSYGLLDGFTISMNSDGSIQLTTTQLQQAKEVMDQINANSSIDVEAEVQTPDESAMANIEQLVNIANSSEAGRQALIDIGFKLPEGGQAITAEQIQQQIGEVKLKWSLESTPTSVPQDVSTATHEQRKAMLSSGGTTTNTIEEQPQPVTIPVNVESKQADSQIQSLKSKWKEPVEIELKAKTTAEPTPANNAEGGSTPKPQKVENGGGSQIKVNVDSSEVDAAQQKVDQLQGTKIDSKTFAIIAQNLSWALNSTNRLAGITIADKEFSVTVDGLNPTLDSLNAIVSALARIQSKSVTITTNHVSNGHDAMGTAHASGTIKTPLKTITNAYANGRDFTVGHKETAIVNQLAPNRPESIIRDGKFSVIPGGPQLMNLRPNDIILNPDQTEDMLKSGKTARAGKLVSAHKTGSTANTTNVSTTLPAFANGTANDLVGERGMEMYVDPYNNEWHTVGASGPEMVDLPKDAIVFNAKQTEDLLTKGHTDTRGNVAFTNGSAEGFDVNDFIETPMDLLSGDAYLSGNAYPTGNNNAQNVSGRATATKKMRDPRGNKSSESSSTNNNTAATDKNTKATKKNTEEKEKEGQVFDWVASRLSYLAEQTAKFADAITDFITYEDKLLNLVGGYDAQLRKSYKGQLESLVEEIAGNRAGAIRYQQEANSVKNPYANPNSDKERQANAKFAETKQMIDAGYKIDIETIKDDKLAKAIQDYQQYADAARQASNNVANLNRSLVELYDTWAKAPAEEAEKQIERLSKGINGLEAAEARLDAVSKGGSTHSILDSLLGRSTSGSYSNLGSAGYRAVASENRLKTYNADQVFKQRTLELDRTLKNFQDFQARQVKQTAEVVRSASNSHTESTSVSGGSTTRITKKQLKAQGRQIASEYGKKLTKKQKKSLKQGKRTTKINKISDNAAKAAVEAQNQRVQAYKIQTATIKQGKSIAKKYSKKLTKEQKKALKSGQQVDTSSVKNKKLKNKLTKYNSRIQKSNSLVTKTVTDTSTTGGVTDIVTAQDIVGNAQEGLQSFLDAINSAETDKITAAAELAAQKVQEIRDNFDYISEAYETQISHQETLNKLKDKSLKLSDAETFGDEVTPDLRDEAEKDLAKLKTLKDRQVKSLQKELKSAVDSKTIIEGSKEWIEMQDKINEAKLAVHDYSVEIKQMEIKKLEDITDHYSKLVDYMQSFSDLNNVWNERDEIVGNYKEASYYTEKITEQEAIRNKKQEEARKEQMQFQRMIGKRGSGATYEIGSDSYIAKQAEINKLWKEAYDAENDLAKLEAERIQFEIDNLNRVLEKQDTFIGNLNTMAGLINDAAKWNYDTGDLTQQGQLTMVVDKEAYNQALDEIQMVATQKEKLLERLRNDASYGQQAYDDDIKELTSKQMSYLQTAKSALESFTKTVETTAQKQLEALNKVIDKRKEALAKEQE